jgi:hypothetical protein
MVSHIPGTIALRTRRSRRLPATTAALLQVYGAAKADWIIIAASLAETSLTGFVLYYKLRGRDRSRGQVAPDRA